MRRGLYLLFLALCCFAQKAGRHEVASILGFENNTEAGKAPVGWSYTAHGAATVDDQVKHSGKYGLRIERTASTNGEFSTITHSLPIDFSGSVIEWRGYIKTEEVTNFVALWIREDGPGNTPVEFRTMQGQKLKDTHDWNRYSLSIPVSKEARQVAFGFLLSGTGRAWVDDLELLVDGKPIGDAPTATVEPTVLEKDHEFDGGSQISLNSLTAEQIGNLALVARVWGFLKYHHPSVTSGKRHWDYEFFRVVPSVLAAKNRGEAQAEIVKWMAKLEPLEECTKCAELPAKDLALAPDIGWIHDEKLLGRDLRAALEKVYRNRSQTPAQFYVSLTPNVGNPVFEHELPYINFKIPDAGYQLLALVRFWNMVQYFSPYRDVMADRPAEAATYWTDILTAFIQPIALAPAKSVYVEQMLKFTAKIHDTHANLWSSLDMRPPYGSCVLPLEIRFVEGKPLVTRHLLAETAPALEAKAGDIVERIDGETVDALIERWQQYYAVSNHPTFLRDFGRSMTRGACSEVSLGVQRGGERLTVKVKRVPPAELNKQLQRTHDRLGDVFQKIGDDIAYLKLSNVRVADARDYITKAAGTKGLIIDIRNYPSEFVVFAIGSLLVPQPTEFARFTKGDPANPGAFYWTAPLGLTPAQLHYEGKVVILVDEDSQSQAEYTAMAFRAVPGAVVIGSTTAGADGNVSQIQLPGNLRSMISGIGVFYPDKRPTQRVGIVPDVEVRPTIKAMQEGRDELVEEAIRIIRKTAAP